jgi:hypothetical protein
VYEMLWTFVLPMGWQIYSYYWQMLISFALMIKLATPKGIGLILLLIAAIGAYYIINKPANSINNRRANNGYADIIRHPARIIYTKHARCRMSCRQFTEAEVSDILANGEVNNAKSNDRPGPCPTYALEGTTSDGQHARMVFAFCNTREAKLITAIDLDTDWQCACY